MLFMLKCIALSVISKWVNKYFKNFCLISKGPLYSKEIQPVHSKGDQP